LKPPPAGRLRRAINPSSSTQHRINRGHLRRHRLPRSLRSWHTDITYLPIADASNLYLATVIDCFSRRLVGWSIADHMRTELVEDALKAAAATRGSLTGAIFHSDSESVPAGVPRVPDPHSDGHDQDAGAGRPQGS
jgi:transposase InsO family protein